MKKYLISEAQIQKLAFGQCCDFQGIVDDVHTRPVEDPCADNGCTDTADCDEICQHSRIYSPVQMQEAIKRATEAENNRVIERILEFCEVNRTGPYPFDAVTAQRIRDFIDPIRIPQEIKK
jgi:hypothetical protein